MIITITCVVCFAIGVIFIDKYWYNNGICFIGCVLSVIGGIGLIFCLAAIVAAHINVEAQLQVLQNTRDMLVYRLEHINELPAGSEMLYSEITEFNNWLYENMINTQNPWINWFYNSAFNDISLISWH